MGAFALMCVFMCVCVCVCSSMSFIIQLAKGFFDDPSVEEGFEFEPVVDHLKAFLDTHEERQKHKVGGLCVCVCM
jgi:hypothetical protein